MNIWHSETAAIAIAGVAFVASATSGWSTAAANRSTKRPIVAVQPGPPPDLGFDPKTQHVGHDREVDKFVGKVITKGGFHNAVPMTVQGAGQLTCDLAISAAVGSFQLAKHNSSNKGYIVALITNPGACGPAGLPLAHNDTAAWYIRYDNPTEPSGTPADVAGYSGLILLRNGTTKDTWIPAGKKWVVGFCNHLPHDNTNDGATAFATSERCTGSARVGHDVARAYKAMQAERDSIAKMPDKRDTVANRRAKKNRRLFDLIPGPDDLALWFACGGDCCYAYYQ